MRRRSAFFAREPGQASCSRDELAALAAARWHELFERGRERHHHVATRAASARTGTNPRRRRTIPGELAVAPGARHERARETFVAHVDFVLRDRVPNAFVRVNPLGLQVSYFRLGQAFQEAGR